MNIIVYTAKPPTPRQSKLVSKLVEIGLDPMVDAVHYWKDWFLQQFVGPHRVYYTEPFLLTGKVTDIDFDISGNPDFVVYTTDDSECTDDEWIDITNWLDAKLRNAPTVKECRLKPNTRPTLLSSPPDIENDPLVTIRDAKDHYYTFEFKHLGDIDLMLYSVHKPFEEEPYTVVVDDFSKNGHTHFFTDIFSNPNWGKDVLNLNFLIKVWGELQMEGELTGQKMDDLLKARTEEFLPKEGICHIEPQVYRKPIEELLKEKASFGVKINS